MDPRTSLLISLVLAIQIAVPIGAYLLFTGRHDDKTRLWLIGVILMSLGNALATIRPFLPEFVSHQMAWIFFAGSLQLLVEVFRRELGRRTNWHVVGIILGFWALYQIAIYALDQTQTLGTASISFVIPIYGFVMIGLLQQLLRIQRSPSLFALQIVLGLSVLPQLFRLYRYLVTGNPEVMNVFGFSLITNLLVFATVFCMLFMTYGYWGFCMEKSQRERDQARVGEDQAIQDADHYRQLVEERDRLVVINSRFSTVSALSSFSAMLIHDITQPLQTLQLGLERIRSNLVKGSPRDQLERDLLHLESTMDRAGALVTALRRLMQSGESKVAPVSLTPLFEKIDSILSSEALKRKVIIELSNDLTYEDSIMADEVMLQRVLINLVANALDQFKLRSVNGPKIAIRLAIVNLEEVPGIAIEVADNAGGFEPEVLEWAGQPWSSQRPGSLGMALMLTKQLLGLWGGQLTLSNRIDGVAGAIVRIWLRKPAYSSTL